MRLKEIRESKNMSQEQLSKQTGLTQPFICEIERGRKNPSLSTLIKVSNALECSIDDLIGTEERRRA